MEVILLENTRNLGSLGEKVNVKPGFGRNYLIPQGVAVAATAANLKDFEGRRAELEKRAAEVLAEAQQRIDKLTDLVVDIPARTGDEGKLYGSVGTREIADAITLAGVEVKKVEVLLPMGAFRFTGEFEVDVQLHSELTTTVKVNVVPEQ